MTSELIASSLVLPNGSTLQNRIAKAAMSEQLAGTENEPNEGLVTLYEAWARGAPGLLITGNVMIDSRALGEPGNVVLEDNRHADAFRDWAASVEGSGVQLWMQLNHPGRQSPRMLSKQPVAPSAVQLKKAGMFAPPRALTCDEIDELVARFATSARLAMEAGFDGVQIHAAHGYLVSQFLSPLTNQREDKWGGPLENRMRFLLEIVRATREATSPTFGIGVKLNSADFQRGGFDQADSVEVVRALGKESLDLLEISGGTYEKTAMWGASDSTREREAYFLDYAQLVRDVATMPLMLTGGFRTSAGMRDALGTGAVDVVGLARPLVIEPDLPKRIVSEKADAVSARAPRVGVASLNEMITGMWHQWQIRRIASGKAPKQRAGLLSVMKILWFTMRRSRSRVVRGLGGKGANKQVSKATADG